MSTTESKTLDDDDRPPTIEYEVIDSDRMDLVSEAVYFCRVMMDRQCGHMGDNAYSPPVDLSTEEQRAYSAALSLLADQFTRGPSKVRRVPKREEL